MLRLASINLKRKMAACNLRILIRLNHQTNLFLLRIAKDVLKDQ